MFDFQGDDLINLAEEILTQYSMQVLVDVLVTTFSQICFKNEKHKAMGENLKIVVLGQKSAYV